MSSSWGRPSTEPKNKPEEKHDDWFSRWQRRKEEQYAEFAKRIEDREKQYSDFLKKVEEDPYGVLFGRYWMKGAYGTQPPNTRDPSSLARNSQRESPSPHAERIVTQNTPPRPSNVGDKQPKPKTVILENREQEYEIDPITMRKVPKTATPAISIPRSQAEISAKHIRDSFEVPVKRFRPASTELASTQLASTDHSTSDRANPSSAAIPSKPQNTKSWLSQEGFGTNQESRPGPRSAFKTEDATPKTTAPKIESALDRHLKDRGPTERKSERTALQYKPEENTTEDIDLLRSSDVRASAGLRGKSAKESDSEKQARQRKLEKEYDRRPLDRESQLAQEIATDALKATGEKADIAIPGSWVNEISGSELDSSTAQKPINQQTKDGPDEISVTQKPVGTARVSSGMQEAMAAKANKIKSQIVPLKVRLDTMKAEYETLRQRWLDENRRQKAAKRVDEIHEEEVKAQKQAMQAMEMRGVHKRESVEADYGDKKPASRPITSFIPGEGDLAVNVHEFAERDRWYKQKAPHAMEQSNTKLQKLAKERDLIREVRDIYEETYGTIDTKHRQPLHPEGGSTSLAISADHAQTRKEDSAQSSKSVPSASSKEEQSRRSGLTQETESENAVKDQSSDPRAIVQQLFSELRQAQDLIQKYRAALNSPQGSEKSASVDAILMSMISKSFEQTVHRIAMAALKLTKSTVANAATPSKGHASTSSLAKATDAETQSPATPSVYRILAYDPATQKVISSPKTTSLAPFSKEQALMPVEALEVLNNPGKFLPHLMTLHNKGYNVVSGTSNILVFKKEATGDELAAAKHAEAMKYPNPVDGTIASTGNFASPTGFVNHDSPIPLEELEQHHAASQAASEVSSETSADNRASSNKVRREEDVFSGGRRGGWQETNGRRFKSKKQRRRKRTLGRMVLTGTLTAACCYAVGVASEMMRH